MDLLEYSSSSTALGNSNPSNLVERIGRQLNSFGCLVIEYDEFESKNENQHERKTNEASDDFLRLTDAENVFRVSEHFFQQPLDIKSTGASFDVSKRGYSAVSTENFALLIANKGIPNDSVEKFRMGPISAENDDFLLNLPKSGKSHFTPNCWPSSPVCMRSVFEQLYLKLEKVAKILCSLFDIIFETNLSDQMNHHTSIMTANYYPPSSTISRIAEHTDVSLFTIITSNAPGLLVRNNTNDWLCIDDNRKCMCVVIGEVFEFWSNGAIRPSLHKVEISEESVRSSLSYFASPNYDACPKHCQTTYHQWRKRKIKSLKSVR